MGINKVGSDKALELSKRKCLEVLNILVDLCEKHEISYWLDGGTLLGAVRHGGMIPWDDDIDVCFPEEDYIKIIDILLAYSKEDNPYTIFFHGSGFRFCYDYFGDSTVLIDGIFPARVDIICVKYVKNTPEAIAIDTSWANIASLYFNGYTKYPDKILDQHSHFIPKGKGKNLLKENELFFNAYFKYMHESMSLVGTENDLLLYYSMNDILVKRERPHFSYSWVFPLNKVVFENRTYGAPNDIHLYLKNLYGENYMQLPPEDQRQSHMDFVNTSNVDKWEWKRFLIDFYKSGFFNFVVTSKNKKLARPLMKMKTFFKLFFKLFFRGNFAMIKGLILYSRNKVSND